MYKNLRLVCLLLTFLAPLGVLAISKSVNLQFLEFEHNKRVNSKDCIVPHFKLNIDGYKGKEMQLAIYFYDEDKQPLKDKDNKYSSSDGNVAYHETLKPGYDCTVYNDFSIEMPLRQLHSKRGMNTIYMMAILWKGNDRLASTAYIPFSCTNGVYLCSADSHTVLPSASISGVRLEPDAAVNGKKALKVHLDGNLKGLKNEKAYMAIWFYDSAGNPHATGASQKANNGESYFKWGITPESEDYSFNVWYAPYYDKIKLLPGTNNYEVVVSLHSPDGKCLATSSSYQFTATGSVSGNSVSSSTSSNVTSSTKKSPSTTAKRKSEPKPDTYFYAVQTIFRNGNITAGDPNDIFTASIGGSAFVSLLSVNGDLANPMTTCPYPAFCRIAEVTSNDRNYDGGIFTYSDDGLNLYYINIPKGYANVFTYMTPGNTNQLLWRTYYSSDPSKAGTGASGTINLNPQLPGFESTSEESEFYESTCPKCNGKKYNSTPYKYAAEASAFHWVGGSGCPYCSSVTDHYHYHCNYCSPNGTITKRR